MHQIPPSGLQGDTRQCQTPAWEALRHAVGDDLLDWFMWMAEIALEDGTRIDVYKHQTTRHYLHLGEDGGAYAYVPGHTLDDPDHYVRTPLALALIDLLHTWWDWPDVDAESAAHARAAIARARVRDRDEQLVDSDGSHA